MKLIVCTSFYDEPPELLTDLVTAVAQVADHLLVVDGPYALYPTEHHTSDTTALQSATRATGLPLTLHTPHQAWAGNEIVKRNQLFRLAHALTESGDWLWILDADMTPTSTDGLRDTLEQTTDDVCTGVLYGDGTDRPHRMLFRTHPQGIHVEGHHAHYLDGDGRTLWNPGHAMQEQPATHIPGLMVNHRPHERSPERNVARLAYYDRARDEKIEDNG